MTKAAVLAPTNHRLEGVVVGLLVGFADGVPLVIYPGNPQENARPARSTAALGPEHVGREVALLFEGGDPARPIVVGPLLRPGFPEKPVEVTEPERLEFTAKHEITLRCGKAVMILTRAGKILLRGTYILSRSSGANKIKGGSIELN